MREPANFRGSLGPQGLDLGSLRQFWIRAEMWDWPGVHLWGSIYQKLPQCPHLIPLELSMQNLDFVCSVWSGGEGQLKNVAAHLILGEVRTASKIFIILPNPSNSLLARKALSKLYPFAAPLLLRQPFNKHRSLSTKQQLPHHYSLYLEFNNMSETNGA